MADTEIGAYVASALCGGRSGLGWPTRPAQRPDLPIVTPCSVRPLRRTFRPGLAHTPAQRPGATSARGHPHALFHSSIPEGLTHSSPALQAAAKQTHATWGTAIIKEDIPEGLRNPRGWLARICELFNSYGVVRKFYPLTPRSRRLPSSRRQCGAMIYQPLRGLRQDNRSACTCSCS
jgi:hypothetical protein